MPGAVGGLTLTAASLRTRFACVRQTRWSNCRGVVDCWRLVTRGAAIAGWGRGYLALSRPYHGWPEHAVVNERTVVMQLSQIAMTAREMDRATAFYADVLGLKLLFRAGELSFFDLGGVRLMLAKPEPMFDHPGSILYFKVEDIAARHAELTAKGVNFIDEPHLIARMPDHELWMTFFRDTEGNTLALMAERRS